VALNGGKSYLASRIVALMPPHLHYAEPYFGGGAVLLARNPADRRLWWGGRTSDGREPDGVSELANDLNGDLVNFYQVLRNPGRFEELRRRLELTPLAEGEWRHARDALKAGRVEDPIERAALFFVLNRQSRQGLMQDFTSPVRTRLRGGRSDPVNSWLGAVEGLEDVHRRLRDVIFVCRAALEVIRSEDKPATLFYCDPPYLHETRSATDAYGRFEMTAAGHRELLEALAGIRGKFILSGYPSALYDGYAERYGWARHTFDVANHAAGGKTKRRMTEVCWMNFRNHP
jgi:DNA adenine methylase